MRLLLLSLISTLLSAPAFGQSPSYTLTIESSPAVDAANGSVYRFYVNAHDDTDKMSAVFGNNQDNLIFETPAGIYNNPFNSGWSAAGLNPAIIAVFPDLADDSFATIGLDGPAASVPGAEDPSLVQDAGLNPTVSGYFTTGGTSLNVSTLTGASWYVLTTAANALPTDGRWLLAQLTTTGDISGQINYQVFPLGVGADEVQMNVEFDGTGTFSEGGALVPGCMDMSACNFNPDAVEDDGSCEYPAYAFDCDGNCILDEDGDGICDNQDPCVPGQEEQVPHYLLDVEEYNVGPLGTTYRFYVNSNNSSDKISAVFGNDQMPLVINTPEGIYNDAFNSSWNASGINPAILPVFPDLAYDSYATIGLEGPASGLPGAEDPSLVQDASLSPTVSGFFQTGGTGLNVNTLTGASWYVLNTASNALPDEDGRWLIAQITTTGPISGTLNYQIFPLGDGANQIQWTRHFDGTGGGGDGDPAPSCGCMDETACNYNPEATNDDGSCVYVEPGACDCLGNVLDGCGVCGGDGSSCDPCAAASQAEAYPLTVEAAPAAGVDGTVYRFYVNAQEGSDKISAVFGSDAGALRLDTPEGIFNSSFNSSWNASGVNPALFAVVPELADDSYATIGLDGPAALVEGAADPSVVQDADLEPTITEYFTTGGTLLEVGTIVGGSWYVLNNATNALPDEDGRWLVAQVTTTGDISGTLNYQVFPLGVGTDQIQVSIDFDGAGTFGGDPEFACGCTDEEACNFDPEATDDDGSCLAFDDCGVCGGDGSSCVAEEGCTDPFAANHDPEAEEDNGSCIYCEAVNTPNTDAPDPMVLGTGIGNTHMHVSEDSCNGISLSLGVLERYVGNLAPEEDDPTNYVIGTGLADVPEGADEGSRWNYLLSINLGEHTFADVDVYLGVDFNPEAEIDLSDPASAYTVFGSYADAFALLGVTELIESSFFQDTQNLGFGLWADVLGGLVSFDPNAEGTYHVGLYAYAPSGPLLASTEISIQTLDEGCTNEDACNYDPEVSLDDGSCVLPDECGICGGDGIPEGACDCLGNVYDDCGICGGNGSTCDPCYAAEQSAAYPLTVEVAPAAAVDGSVYRFYVNAQDASDKISAVFGSDAGALVINTPDGIFNSSLNPSWNATGINPALFGSFPELADDSYATLGIDGPATSVPGAVDPSVVQDANLEPTITEYFTTGGTSLNVNTIVGGSWYILNTATNALPDADGRWLVAQVTTTGTVSGVLNYQIFPLGMGTDQIQLSIAFNGAGTFGDNEVICGCTDGEACNFNADATLDDGSCEFVQEWACDCEGNVLDECGVCGGEGAVYDCGCSDIPDGDCDCDGNQLDALGVCGGDCEADEDEDGICDDVDDCIGVVDFCGECNGPGAIFECGCHDIPEGDCDCLGSQLDALGVCGGDCEADEDGDGICDDVDDCVGAFDSCGLCNGPGAIYDCGCTDIPEGDCDCLGNQLDALGVCGGTCQEDINMNGVCDPEETGCSDESACNYAPEASFVDDALCVYPAFNSDCDGNCLSCESYHLTVEAAAAVQPGMTTYRLKVNLQHPADRVSAVYGFDEAPMVVSAPAGVFNSEWNLSWSASGLGAAFIALYPEMVDDTYATVGLEGPASESDLDNAEDPDLVEDAMQSITPFFLQDGATGLEASTIVGASWYVVGGDNALGDADMRVLIMQVTTTGDLSGVVNYQVFPEGDGLNAVQITTTFNGAGNFTPDVLGCTDPAACNYDAAANMDDGTCDLESCYGCTDPAACNYDETATLDDGLCDLVSCYGCTDPAGCNYDASATLDDGLCDLESCYGCTEPGACNYDATATLDDGGCDFESCLGCTDPAGCNYDETATQDDGSCEFVLCYGCTDPAGCNFDVTATIDDGSCDFESCYGCMDAMGCNYDATATLDDGSCDFESCYGCMEAEACNFDATATFDDGSCDFLTCVGCTYPGACNFSAEATEDDGSCDFSCLLTGCTDPNAVNHFAAALSDDGSCLYVGCMDPDGLDYDPTANYPGGCDYPDPCPGDFTGNGVVDINDLLDFFQLWGNECELTEEQIQANGPGEGAGPGDGDTGNAAWSCGDPLNYQGYDYETVLIGEQCWFAENLQAQAFGNGDAIPSTGNTDDWLELSAWPGAPALWDVEVDGTGSVLYNWYVVDDVRPVCPAGWRVPTDGDWQAMETLAGVPEEELALVGTRGSSANAGGNLKSTSSLWTTPNEGATDLLGFQGEPFGRITPDGLHSNPQLQGYFWNGSASGGGDYHARVLTFESTGVYRYTWDYIGGTQGHRMGMAIRCIEN